MQSARFGHTSVPASMIASWRGLLSRLAASPSRHETKEAVIRAEEREQCAKVAGSHTVPHGAADPERVQGYKQGRLDAAAAIRARGQ